MRLIDADALEKDLFPGGTSGGFWGFGQLCETLDRQPTVDAVPVVRCEKCTHHKGLNAMEKFEYGSNVVWCNIPHFGGVLMKNDAFCSYGERKDGE